MTLTVRPATKADARALGRMGAALARLHGVFDPERFMVPDELESGYEWWLSRELDNPKATVHVAERDGEVVGYCYGRLQSRDWNKLLERHGELVDLWVDAEARCGGAGEALVTAVVRWFEERGAPRVVLMSATKNEPAQRLFARLGFRYTMVEMTRESAPTTSAPKRPSRARRP